MESSDEVFPWSDEDQIEPPPGWMEGVDPGRYYEYVPTSREIGQMWAGRLNRGADRALGAVVEVSDGRGDFEIGDILEVARLRFEYLKTSDDLSSAPWTVMQLLLEVPGWAYDAVAGEPAEAVRVLINQMLPVRVSAEWIRVAPLAPGSTWRTDRMQARDDGARMANQALFTTTNQVEVHDRLRFANRNEVALYMALKAVQADLPANETLGIMPGPGFRTVGHTYGPDCVVIYRHRAIAIEVDGHHHARRYAYDRSKDDLLKDCGLIDVYRLPVEDTEDPGLLASHVERVMARLRA